MFHGTISRNGMEHVTTKSGQPLKASPLARLVSPTGFNWGYNGSGPFALAHSMLCHLVGKKAADKYATQFRQDVISRLDHAAPFELPYSVVREWLATQK